MTTESTAESADGPAAEPAAERRTWLMILAWVWVGVPFAYGVYELFLKLTQLFSG
ncbi:hypothetical protein ACFMQL_25865 [Nonomuraea fastidiosa]|jgi:hypothetical protein|uniref:MFS transporter small subunit n=1 Tax=Nonomuraea TaxID=83681 RepID=UPI0034339199